MQRRTEESIHERMAEQRLACIREIQIQRQRADLAASSFRHSLLSVRSLAEQNLADRGPFLPSSALLPTASEGGRFLSIYWAYRFIITSLNPDLFSFFVNSWISLQERLSAIEEGIAEKLGRLKDSLKELEADLVEALSGILFSHFIYLTTVLYDQGVRFIFGKIDRKNPNEEYSFSIRLDNDAYNCKFKVHVDIS
ncbi:hypothetical protein B296_00032646 [Ensete ventricosum]|uniref:Kinetochore protein SPC25 n=1 Tax=Ensete ventricosum TaxID=4639 RepID=A0A426YCR7_ENSVE|nr:hypothetical protein B296_00032646 [Ensete ventricosum]